MKKGLTTLLAIAGALTSGTALAATAAPAAPNAKKAVQPTNRKARSIQVAKNSTISDPLRTSKSATAPASSGTSRATTAGTAASAARSRLSASFITVFLGPSIKSGGYRPNEITGQANLNAPLQLRNILQADYRISDNLLVGPSVQIRTFNHERQYAADVVDISKRAFLWEAYVRARVPRLYSKGAFNLYSDVRLFAPMNPVERASSHMGGLANKLFATYTLPKTGLTLGLESFLRVNAYSDRQAAASNGQADFLAYIGPQLSYQVTPKFALTALYEAEAAHVAGGMGLQPSFTDMEIGASWDITPRINLSPTLNFKTGQGQRLNAATTGINAVLSISLL